MRGGEEIHQCCNRRTKLCDELDAVSRGLEATSDRRAHKELEQRLTAIQTSLNAVEAYISKFENLIEECRMVEEEVHQMEEEEASPDQPDPEEQATDMDMADQEDSAHLDSSDPTMEVTTEDNPPLASGRNTITPEEEEILLAGMLQSEYHSTGSETASVSGGMAELHLSSPAHARPEEETPQ